jgi:hypothetical protein
MTLVGRCRDGAFQISAARENRDFTEKMRHTSQNSYENPGCRDTSSDPIMLVSFAVTIR